MSDELPKGWAEITLQDAGAWRSGGNPSRQRPEYFGKGIPWVKSGDLPDGPILKTQEEITKDGLENSAAKLMPAGTISMALYGATIGKLGLMTFPAATNQACANVVPDTRLIEPQFLFNYLLSERRNFIEQGQRGAQPNISQEIVRSHPFPLAPLAEQRRIVAKLEKLLGQVDACQQRLEKMPTLLKRFRQSVLAAACSGRLTADWRKEKTTDCTDDTDKKPSAKSAKSVVQSLVRENAGSAEDLPDGRRNAPFQISEPEHELPDLPDKWKWVALGNYARCYRGRFSPRPRNDPRYFNGKHPFIQIGNLPREGGLVSSHVQTLNDEGLAVSRKFPKGTVVIATVGATIGNTGVLGYDMSMARCHNVKPLNRTWRRKTWRRKTLTPCQNGYFLSKKSGNVKKKGT
jgi:type I restriction enzyme S subunit